jgi:hypothetical protein
LEAILKEYNNRKKLVGAALVRELGASGDRFLTSVHGLVLL